MARLSVRYWLGLALVSLALFSALPWEFACFALIGLWVAVPWRLEPAYHLRILLGRPV